MKPSPAFQNQSSLFWADVRAISQLVGYTKRNTNEITIPTQEEIEQKYRDCGLSSDHLFSGKTTTEYGTNIISYLEHRAHCLNNYIQHQLMDAEEAEKLYNNLKETIKPPATLPQPMNKQTGDKKTKAFFTCMINILIQKAIQGIQCDYDPRSLPIFSNRAPCFTLSRRVDGAFPSILNPKAIWEIKEYYFTTTFGSRVADGVFETSLDGLELEQASNQGIKCLHYLFVDGKYTWWNKGKSYLCRLVDSMHMGSVDEVIFGREIVNRIPEIVKDWFF